MKIATFCYHLAISCWLGGAALFTFLLTPILLHAFSRDLAGGIVGVLFPGYFRWSLVCGVVALFCRLLVRGRFTLVAACLLTAMLALTAVQATVLEPRAAALKREIPSFVTTLRITPRACSSGDCMPGPWPPTSRSSPEALSSSSSPRSPHPAREGGTMFWPVRCGAPPFSVRRTTRIPSKGFAPDCVCLLVSGGQTTSR